MFNAGILLFSRQLFGRLLRSNGSNRRSLVFLDVSRDEVPRAAGMSGSNLHHVLEVRYQQLCGVVDSLRVSGSYTHGTGQFDYKVANTYFPTCRGHDVKKVLDGVPGNAHVF